MTGSIPKEPNKSWILLWGTQVQMQQAKPSQQDEDMGLMLSVFTSSQHMSTSKALLAVMIELKFHVVFCKSIILEI